MTRPMDNGGLFDKLGNRYECWWTVHQLVRIVAGEAISIRIEDPTYEQAEFALTTSAGVELHQTKRAHSTGRWSLSELGSTRHGLLQAINRELGNGAERFVFVSRSDVGELSPLIEAAVTLSFTEFESGHLAAEVQRKAFEKLLSCWAGASPKDAYLLLRRIEIRITDERSLVESTEHWLRTLFLNSPTAVADRLRNFAGDNLRSVISRDALLEHLESKGFKLRTITNGFSAVPAIDRLTAKYTSSLEERLLQPHVPRQVVAKILSRIESATCCGIAIALTGAAGSGKSACALQLVDQLRARGTLVLSFRLDRLNPVSTAFEVGEQLGLGESPAHVLAAAAREKPSVLVIDQLDAVSTTSGRNAAFLDAVKSIADEVRILGRQGPIHMVLCCRKFDWQNDSRLRGLMALDDAPLEVTDFTIEEITPILTQAGVKPQGFSQKQLGLLCLPQNLAMFLAGNPKEQMRPGFRSVQDLYKAYWEEKRRAVTRRTEPEPDRWLEVIDPLVERITAAQHLFVRAEVLDDLPPDCLDQMVSEGVLVRENNSYSSGHESFFDYCFARRFIRQNQPLLDFLLSTEQHLFRRAQVRQVLTYLREEGDEERYLRECSQLLGHEKLRTHLKDLVFSLIANVPEVSDREWHILLPFVESHLGSGANGLASVDAMPSLAWRNCFGSDSWFVAATARGYIAPWLAGDNEVAKAHWIGYLWYKIEKSGADVAALVEPYTNAGGPWRERLRHLMAHTWERPTRRVFDLLLRLIANGTLDRPEGTHEHTNPGGFWSHLYALGPSRPEWVAEAVATWLKRRLSLVIGGQRRDWEAWHAMLGFDITCSESIRSAARDHPGLFLSQLLPVALEIAEEAVRNSDDLPRKDSAWYDFGCSYHPDLKTILNEALGASIEALAGSAPDAVKPVESTLRDRNTVFANQLLLRLYKANPARYADTAASAFDSEPWRFESGPEDSCWIARQTLAAIAPECSPGSIRALEACILAFSPKSEQDFAGRRSRVHVCYQMLSAMPSTLRSVEAEKRYAEFKRKFGDLPDAPPTPKDFGFIGSPIPEVSIKKMSDSDWLSEMTRYTGDHNSGSPELIKGGPVEIARQLAVCVKEEPERFAKLLIRFPEGINDNYYTETLSALRNPACPLAVKEAACRIVFQRSPVAGGKAVADMIGHLVDCEQPLADEFLQMLHWLATQHPDPESELWQSNEAEPGYFSGEILTAGINTGRGHAVKVVAKLVFQSVDNILILERTLSGMLEETRTCVKACSAETALMWSNHDPERAIAWFSLLGANDAVLLSTQYAERFLLHLLSEYFEKLRPHIETLIRSDNAQAAKSGSRLAAMAVLWGHPAADLVERAIAGTPAHRNGLAEVASRNIKAVDTRTWCEQTLITLLHDPEKDVRAKAACVFLYLDAESPTSYTELIKAYCETEAFQKDQFGLLHWLEKSTGYHPEILCHVCERYLDRVVCQPEEIRAGRLGDFWTASKLIYRLYSQGQKEEWGARCLTMIDTIIREGIGDREEALAEYER